MNLSELILDAAKKDSLAAKSIELFEADSSTLEVVVDGGNTFLQITKFGETAPCSSVTIVGGIEGIINALQSNLGLIGY
jgi:hypothetical protein